MSPQDCGNPATWATVWDPRSYASSLITPSTRRACIGSLCGSWRATAAPPRPTGVRDSGPRAANARPSTSTVRARTTSSWESCAKSTRPRARADRRRPLGGLRRHSRCRHHDRGHRQHICRLLTPPAPVWFVVWDLVVGVMGWGLPAVAGVCLVPLFALGHRDVETRGDWRPDKHDRWGILWGSG